MTRQESIEKLNQAGWTSRQIQHVMKVIEEDCNGDISWAAITQRLLNHEPIEYITGYDYFMNLKLHVSKDVLLPRPETEDLMALIFQHIPTENTAKASFLDIGTGSGCIALALKQRYSTAQVHAIDVCPKALAIAEKNSQMHDLSLSLRECDILKLNDWEGGKLKYIVSNPPYIPPSERQIMAETTLSYEPEIALFVDEEDPLVFYRHIGLLGHKTLLPKGEIWVECGFTQGNDVAQLFENQGYATSIYEDSSRVNRFVRAIK
ncbi:MAG: protein-(glutamine-N5) methyltransferase, release factor-specific [Saprospirales bacterium TMED214]|nr:MAG: protein-(glutamine-N5) methyltransferase, release factor-specific [Saprospirales bacterium TMED214]